MIHLSSGGHVLLHHGRHFEGAKELRRKSDDGVAVEGATPKFLIRCKSILPREREREVRFCPDVIKLIEIENEREGAAERDSAPTPTFHCTSRKVLLINKKLEF
ncbi:hypothetical protein ACS0TY_028402 [Phlomoides rotata]